MHGVYRLDDGTHGYISKTACHNSDIFAFLYPLQNLVHGQLENTNWAK